MPKLVKAFLIVAFVWVLIVGAGYLAWGEFLSFVPRIVTVNEKAERIDDITQSASGLSKVSIDTKNGSVIVTKSNTSDVVIKAVYSASSTSVASAEERLQEMRTDITVSGSTLNIVAVYPQSTISNQSIRYEVAIPENLDLKVKTSNGRITVEGIESKVDLHSSNGTVEVRSDVGPEELSIYTSNGRIDVTAAPQAGNYTLRTSNGSVTVALPETQGVAVRANTSNGSITLGYGQWSFSGGQVSNKSINAQMGDGSLILDITTSNGSIKLNKR